MIDSATFMGAVHLAVADLDRSIAFYERHLGLVVHGRTARGARLGAGRADLLVLEERPGAVRPRGTTGLYHFALLVPTRLDLARSLRRLMDLETRMQGFADHGVSEALYLADPDGNGIEIYRDRSRDEWPVVNGHFQMGTDPLDLGDLIGELDGSGGNAIAAPMHAGTRMGHVHLHVAHLDAAEEFYVRVLGFNVTQRYGGGALFVSAGGYHHHLGLNTWAGVGAPPPPAEAIGLRRFAVHLPDETALGAVVERVRAAGISIEPVGTTFVVRDPSSNTIQLTAP